MTADDAKNPKSPPPAAAPKTPKRTDIPLDDENIAHERPLDWQLTVRLMQFLKPYRRRMAAVVGLVAVSTLLALLTAQAFSEAIERLSTGEAGAVMFWAAVLAVAGVVSWLIDWWRGMTLMRTGQYVLFDLRTTIFRHLQRLSLSYYDRTKQGWIISRATSDLGALEEILIWTVPQLASVVFLIAGGTIWMLMRSPMLFLVLLGAVPVMTVITFVFHRYISDAWRDVRTQVSRICANLAENIAGVRVVQAFTRERRNLREFDQLNLAYYKARVRATMINALYFPSIGLCTSLATGAVILVVGWKARALVELGQESRVGDVVLVLLLLRLFFEPVRQLSQMYGSALGAMASAERVFQLLDTQPDVVDRPGARALGPIRGDVRFEDVTFAYREGEPVLTGVNIDVKAGQTVALVGPTGAGKSSIIKLLCRFYEPQAGRITVDGVDIREVTQHSLRSQMGIVNQDAFLFTGTVMDNIKLGRPDATEEEVTAAAMAIGAHDVLAGLRDGYKTYVHERGEGLSGGERQLVCFARAMLADPRILVLDEATSSVDTGTERKIQHALERLVQKRTSFVVAHRLSTVRNADQVLVVKDGRILERGTHASLLAANGEYTRMYREFLREG